VLLGPVEGIRGPVVCQRESVEHVPRTPGSSADGHDSSDAAAGNRRTARLGMGLRVAGVHDTGDDGSVDGHLGGHLRLGPRSRSRDWHVAGLGRPPSPDNREARGSMARAGSLRLRDRAARRRRQQRVDPPRRSGWRDVGSACLRSDRRLCTRWQEDLGACALRPDCALSNPHLGAHRHWDRRTVTQSQRPERPVDCAVLLDVPRAADDRLCDPTADRTNGDRGTSTRDRTRGRPRADCVSSIRCDPSTSARLSSRISAVPVNAPARCAAINRETPSQNGTRTSGITAASRPSRRRIG
jgi:hypothetical protein